ncbi:hypothetical protein HFP89_07070 [Wenzhouxiangella sp. XN79A]|uniref:hypothetical protein n=1 Tax=Wenzhouxiangella sp. XN79A TaxID=2724193 RepID=UPI00144AA2FD|nr:hypothetical protein [Wenzhouxiangella sp. XN79A]NKI34922.1 hypothetical protein [Wenzhouxiangella sp. XN79A]
MADSLHPIRLVAGIELRPPPPGARYVLERDDAETVGGAIGDDLARCVPSVTGARLITGPALLEPGQVLSPGHAPYTAMQTVAGAADEPGLTTLGAAGGRLSHDILRPVREPPDGLFLVLPLLLLAPADRGEAISADLEQALFDTGGLHPPSLAALAQATGLEPVHGQLMTWADLAALVKMQLAGAGLDPFWPPIEHTLVAPDEDAVLALPAGLEARWDGQAGGWTLPFRLPADEPSDGDALWLRAFRQTVALLETHLVPWRASVDDPAAELDPEQRWIRIDRGPIGVSEETATGIETLQHPDIGLIGFDAVVDGRRVRALPLVAEAIPALKKTLNQSLDPAADA